MIYNSTPNCDCELFSPCDKLCNTKRTKNKVRLEVSGWEMSRLLTPCWCRSGTAVRAAATSLLPLPLASGRPWKAKLYPKPQPLLFLGPTVSLSGSLSPSASCRALRPVPPRCPGETGARVTASLLTSLATTAVLVSPAKEPRTSLS